MGSEIGEKSMILTEKALKFSLNSLIHILLCIGPPCIENDIDERLDTTEVELVKALKKIDRKRAESRLFFRNPRPVWSPVEKLMRKQFEDKFCTEKGSYKYYVGYYADHI